MKQGQATAVYEDIVFFDAEYQRYLLLEERDGFVDSYIEEHFNQESWEYQHHLMIKYPFFGNKILDDFELTNSEKHDVLFRNLVFNDKGGGRIVLVDGARGGGKTGFGCWCIDEFKKMRSGIRMYFVTKAQQKPKLPEWVHIVENIEAVPNNSVALIDEGAIQLSSRRSTTKENRDASDRLVVLRHKGITLIILVQNIKMVDINVRRLADIRILKYGISFGSEEDSGDDVKLIRERLRPKSYAEAYCEIPAKRIFLKFSHGLPEWFDTETTSKSFKDQEMSQLHGKKEEKALNIEAELPQF